MYVTRRVRLKRIDETFLSSLEPGEGDSIKALMRVLNCRLPKVLHTGRNYTIIAEPSALEAVRSLVGEISEKKLAAFGTINETLFVAVPYNKERLVKNLIRSSNKFREVYRGVRLIFDEFDLLNNPREFPKDRAYKDDE